LYRYSSNAAFFVNEKSCVIRWDYACAYSLNGAHRKQKSTLLRKVWAFFVFSVFEKDFERIPFRCSCTAASVVNEKSCVVRWDYEQARFP
jgi:hypothetical protein